MLAIPDSESSKMRATVPWCMGPTPPCRVMRTRAPSLGPRADDLCEELKTIVERARTTANDRTLDQPERDKRTELLGKDFEAWQSEFARWVKEEGSEYKVTIQKPESKSGSSPGEAK